MPIFEYECHACQASFEKLVRSPADVPSTCRQCGSSEIDRRPSVFGMSIKGGESKATSSSGCGGCARSSCAGCHR